MCSNTKHKKQKTNQKRIRKGETIMVNVGIIGAGRIGQVHMNSILTRVPNAKIKAVADPFLSEEADKKAKAAGAVCFRLIPLSSFRNLFAMFFCLVHDMKHL